MVPGLEDTFSAELPNLASGADTPEQFCQVLTDFATANHVTCSATTSRSGLPNVVRQPASPHILPTYHLQGDGP